jgi:CRP-like cAMP-binding protein
MVAVDTLKTSPLFSELNDRELRLITPLCREKRYAKGETIFAKGDEANTVYLLQEGKVRLGYEICPQPDACQDTTIPVDQPGEVIGWSALVKPRRLTASAHCITDVRLITVDGEALEQLMEQDSHIGFVVMKALAGVIADRLRQAKELTLGRVMGAL